MTEMRKSTWNTYHVQGYTSYVADDTPSQGGVHFYEVRRAGKSTPGEGQWEIHICQSNGKHQAYSVTRVVPDAEGIKLYVRALQYRRGERNAWEE